MNYYADGWRWSPDGRSIAYWQLNADRVRNFDLVNNTDSLYSRVIPVQYPKVGEAELRGAHRHRAARRAAPPRWLEIEGDPREHYIPRMDWAASSDEVILQRLNRLQNTDEVMLGDVRTGQVRTVLTERDSTWVDVVDDLVWLKSGKEFTWVSERDGWKHVYAVSRDGKSVRLVTPGRLRRARGRRASTTRAAGSTTSRRPTTRRRSTSSAPGSTARARPERISPSTEPGTHAYDRAPNYKYAIETYSSLGQPAGHPPGAAARQPGRSAPWSTTRRCAPGWPTCAAGPVEWLTIPTADGARMPGVLMKPADFDSTRKYPLLFFVYGGPGNAEVEDQWGGYWLWHTMLTQKGYLVAIVDNRGTPAPLGRAWRKAIYGQLGVLETQDQAVGRPHARAAAVRRSQPASASGAGATAGS